MAFGAGWMGITTMRLGACWRATEECNQIAVGCRPSARECLWLAQVQHSFRY